MKGKKVTTFNLNKGGKTLLVGFNPEEFEKIL